MSSRVLRDDLWTSERVNALHDKTFRLYLCLINAADDYGLVEIGFGAIKRAAPLLAWTREEVAKMLGELTDANLIRPYEANGKAFAAIERWQTRVNCWQPKYPIPSFGLTHCLMPTGFKDQRTRSAASLILKHLAFESEPPGDPKGTTGAPPVTEGVRGKGEGVREKEKKKRRNGARSPKASLPLPDDFALTAELLAQCVKRGLTKPEVERAFTRFTDNAKAKGHQYADWPAAFRTWCNFDVERKIKAGEDPNDPDAYLREGGYTVS
jgi:hypothetical protein